MTDSNTLRDVSWFRIALVVALVAMSATAPVLAQEETGTTVETATDTGPSYEACPAGPRAPDQTPTITEPTEERLVIETRGLYNPNDTYGYEVYRVGPDMNKQNVTANASVESSNSSILSVDQQAHTLTAVDDENVSTWVRVNATTSDNEGCVNVMVASNEVENMELLPGVWRWVAVLQDSTLFALLIAVFLAVAVTRFSTSWGGLAIGQMTLTVGWLAGYVDWVMAAVSLFVVLFIGLNLAANIDYSVRR